MSHHAHHHRNLFCATESARSPRVLRLRAFYPKGRKENAQSVQRSAYRNRIAALALLAIAAPIRPARSETGAASLPIQYTIALTDLSAHKLHVTVALPCGADERDLQLPVWNALYQVRDFSQYVNWVRATNRDGQPLPIRLLDKSRWRASGAVNGAEIEYEILAQLPGPYGAELNSKHAFFNLAEILMYPVDARSAPVNVSFREVPANWKIATTLEKSPAGGFAAQNYDLLVDSPVEISPFEE